ncbi:MAG: biopolymer transporter ExbD [Bdellovibrionota bacterium]
MSFNKGLKSSPWKKSAKGRASGDVSLNITAMADIFTVLLVFLLKSYASGAMAVNTTAELSLPSAKNQSTLVEATKIEISAEHLVVEGESIVALHNFKFPSDDLLPVGISKKLFETLKANKDKSQDPSNSKVIILADKGVPYSSLKVILTSAAGSGLTDFKLAVKGME